MKISAPKKDFVLDEPHIFDYTVGVLVQHQ